MISYKLFSLITGLIIAATLIKLVRNSKVHSSLFVWWTSIIGLILVFAFYPTLIDVMGKWFGISYPPIIISLAGIGLLLIKTLSMDIYITKNEIRYKKLAQKMALLEKELKEKAHSS
jgi:hypothetical protein